jgi:hypothetical protein
MDREPAEGPRYDHPPGRDSQAEVEPEEPRGRATRGTTNRGSVEAGWTPPREESRENDAEMNPHRPRRTTM